MITESCDFGICLLSTVLETLYFSLERSHGIGGNITSSPMLNFSFLLEEILLLIALPAFSRLEKWFIWSVWKSIILFLAPQLFPHHVSQTNIQSLCTLFPFAFLCYNPVCLLIKLTGHNSLVNVTKGYVLC